MIGALVYTRTFAHRVPYDILITVHCSIIVNSYLIQNSDHFEQKYPRCEDGALEGAFLELGVEVELEAGAREPGPPRTTA